MSAPENRALRPALRFRSPWGEGMTAMPQFSRFVFGAIAVSLSFGAVQFAPAHDLTGIAASPETVNRTAKADRVAAVPAAGGQTRTIALRFESLADTSVLIRMPVAKEARNAPVPAAKKTGDRKMAVACEPPVSVLSEVAKLMQPGRCVT